MMTLARVAALLTTLAATASAAPSYQQERALREAVWGGRWLEGVRLYEELDSRGLELSGQASYLAGWAQWKLRRPEEAKPLLEKAAAAGFQAGGGRLQPGEILEKIAAYETLKPPAAKVAGVDESLIETYADARTPRTAPVLDGLPRMAEIGRSVFGEPPPVRFFLFARLPRFIRFYDLFGEGKARREGAPHSTGGVGMVIYCEEKAHRATVAETVSLALHELTHAWAATYLRRRYDRVVRLPPYVDEGLAVYVASLWSEDVRALTRSRFDRWRARNAGPLPDLEALRVWDGFYAPQQALLDYWLAHLLVERLLGPPSAGAAKIPALLDAFARTGDDAAAWREVTGKDVRAEYRALIAELGTAR